jgi:hypothetical protein
MSCFPEGIFTNADFANCQSALLAIFTLAINGPSILSSLISKVLPLSDSALTLTALNFAIEKSTRYNVSTHCFYQMLFSILSCGVLYL